MVGVFVDRETQRRSLCVFVERLENVITGRFTGEESVHGSAVDAKWEVVL